MGRTLYHNRSNLESLSQVLSVWDGLRVRATQYRVDYLSGLATQQKSSVKRYLDIAKRTKDKGRKDLYILYAKNSKNAARKLTKEACGLKKLSENLPAYSKRVQEERLLRLHGKVFDAIYTKGNDIVVELKRISFEFNCGHEYKDDDEGCPECNLQDGSNINLGRVLLTIHVCSQNGQTCQFVKVEGPEITNWRHMHFYAGFCRGCFGNFGKPYEYFMNGNLADLILNMQAFLGQFNCMSMLIHSDFGNMVEANQPKKKERKKNVKDPGRHGQRRRRVRR